MNLVKVLRPYQKCFSKSYKGANYSMSHNNSAYTITNSNDIQAFRATLPKVISVVTENEKLRDIESVKEWIKTVITKNVGGKLVRGLTTVQSYQAFENPEKVTPETLELARVAGWCVEMMHGTLIISDDIVDDATTRRGEPCWFRNPELGLRAINDALLLQGCYLEVVKQFFKSKPYYTNFMEILNDTIFYTAIGQHLDCKTQQHATYKNEKDYNQFTMKHYKNIVKYKTAYYSINFPIALGYLLTAQYDDRVLGQIRDLCIDFGTLYQVQDDYIDLYGDPELKGKEGNDIQEGKCTWLSVTALENCTPRQYLVFMNCYGSKEPGHCERIVQLYKELRIEDLYKKFEYQQYKELKKKIEELPADLCPELFTKILSEIYQRNY